MKTLALAVLVFAATAVEGKHISQSTMGGDLDVPNAPHGATLRTMGGDIRVGTAQGRVIAKTMGGNIRIRNLAGSLEAGTMGGNVEVDVSKGEGNIEITSLGGQIEITLPANFSGSFDIEVEMDEDDSPSEIVSDFPLQIQESKKERWFRPDTTVIRGKGISGNGMHRVKLTTIGGDVTIRKK